MVRADRLHPTAIHIRFSSLIDWLAGLTASIEAIGFACSVEPPVLTIILTALLGTNLLWLVLYLEMTNRNVVEWLVGVLFCTPAGIFAPIRFATQWGKMSLEWPVLRIQWRWWQSQ